MPGWTRRPRSRHDRSPTGSARRATRWSPTGSGAPPLWRLGLQAFPLNLSALALTLIPADPTDPEGLLQGFRERLDAVRGLGTGSLPLLILSADGETQRDLNRRTADRRDRLIAPAPEVVTRLLLSADATGCAEVLARALAERIPRTELSPYQTGGGVQDPRMFFGRAGLLDHIVNRDPGNYLIVGGRQVGKSSLLQAVGRALAGSTRVQVHYCPLGGADLAGPLAAALGLAPGAGLADIEALLHRSGAARPRVLLIDESDAFVRVDAERDYAVLKRLRGLSESGLAYFSFAGYWTLFERSALDFHSPLKNFGELIQVEELEWEACLALVQRPLGWLGLSLASNALAQRLVRDCGQRANLIAMACHQLVARVRPDQREIGAADLQAVLASERIVDELLGNWRALVADEAEQRLDRMAVYASVDWDDFGYGELAARLLDAGLAVEQADTSDWLDRLGHAAKANLAEHLGVAALIGCLPVWPEPVTQIFEIRPDVGVFRRRTTSTIRPSSKKRSPACTVPGAEMSFCSGSTTAIAGSDGPPVIMPPIRAQGFSPGWRNASRILRSIAFAAMTVPRYA